MTNTLALQQYMLSLLVSNANLTAEAWSLEIERPVTTNQITVLQWRADTNGVSARARIGKRYEFLVRNSKFQTFRDLHFWEASPSKLPENDEEPPELRLLSSEAESIARNTLRQLGLSEERLALKDPPSVEQVEYENVNGRIVKLPHYKVRWDPDEDHKGLIEIQVSSITRKAASFFMPWWNLPPAILPTNYSQMLGLPPPGPSSTQPRKESPAER